MPNLIAKESRIDGTGCYAGKDFKKDDVIGEYTGEHINEEEADERYEDEEKTYLFDIGDGDYIDAMHEDNPIKYINHSCDPNCESEQDGKRILIRALRDITAGEELTYDYHLIVDEDDEDDHTCRCGSPHCRGTQRAED